MRNRITPAAAFILTEGLDLGDQESVTCLIDESCRIVGRGRIKTTAEELTAHFGQGRLRRVVLEASTHSPWVGRLIKDLGHELIVANPRHVHLIANNQRKNDHNDAELLARMGRADPELLSPVTPRSEQQQDDLSLIRQREGFVRSRTREINIQRSLVKSTGDRLPSCSAESFHRKITAKSVSARLWDLLEPGVTVVECLSLQIKVCDDKLETIGRKRYPQIERLQKIHGVGPVVALAYVLTLGDPSRFSRSREVGAYIGLVPAQKQSSQSNPQLSITKCGNTYLRCLLVNAAQRILQKRSPDCALKQHGLRIYQAQGETRIAKRKAVIAVARKLAVIMHRVWVSGQEYDPFHGAKTKPEAAGK